MDTYMYHIAPIYFTATKIISQGHAVVLVVAPAFFVNDLRRVFVFLAICVNLSILSGVLKIQADSAFDSS